MSTVRCVRLTLALTLALVFFSSLALLGCGDAEGQAAVVATSSSTEAQVLPTSHGINYDPSEISGHPDFVSTAQLRFEATAEVAGGVASLVADGGSVARGSACGGPCNVHLPSGPRLLNCRFDTAPDGTQTATCDVEIIRFAQFGRTESPVGFDWLVVMDEAEGLLSGTLTTTVGPDGRLVFPAEIVLGGEKMVVTMEPDGGAPVRLRSRETPVLRGMAPAWPPHGLVLELANGPIPYYLEGDVDDPGTQPVMSITSNTVTLEPGKSAFLSIRPQIQSAGPVAAGVALRWTDSAAETGDPAIVAYYVYRNLTPGVLEGWERIAVVPATQTSYVDSGLDGSSSAAYLVTHAAQYPFGHLYEGLPGQPVTVAGTAPRSGGSRP